VIGRDCLGNIAGKPIELIGGALSEADRVWPKCSSAAKFPVLGWGILCSLKEIPC
jgi:hypothetical protein